MKSLSALVVMHVSVAIRVLSVRMNLFVAAHATSPLGLFCGALRNAFTVCVAVLLAMILNTSAAASEPEAANIGFMQNPSNALTERFPMCEAFLTVEWIDKEKMIGYSTYDAIIKSKNGKSPDERKRVWAIVAIPNGIPVGFDYDVYQYKRQGRLNEVFEAIKNGTVGIGIPMMIKHKGETIVLYASKTLNSDANRPLLSDHKQTVCIAYPDGQRAWIVEGKSIRQTYTTEQLDKLSDTFKSKTWNIPRSRIEELWLLDINHDGVKDFIFSGTFIYSASEGLQKMKQEFEYPDFKFTFHSKNQECRLRGLLHYILTTDGKQYYLDGQCNLTKLSTSTEEK